MTTTRNVPDVHAVRRAGTTFTVGGFLTALSAAVVATVVTPATEVPDTMWSYPWSSRAVVPVSLFYALLHLLVLVGLVGFSRAAVAGTGRAARVGPGLAVAGTAVLVVAELLSIPVAGQRVDDTGPGLVGACFGLGTLLSALGFLLAGVATLRARRWTGWRRLSPLVTGLWLVVMIGLVGTPLLAVAVTVYGVLLTVVGLALASAPVPARGSGSLHPAGT